MFPLYYPNATILSLFLTPPSLLPSLPPSLPRYLVHDKLASLPPGYTPGVQLLGLRPETKDGFVVLLLPMLRHARPELEILVREGREGWREGL